MYSAQFNNDPIVNLTCSSIYDDTKKTGLSNCTISNNKINVQFETEKEKSTFCKQLGSYLNENISIVDPNKFCDNKIENNKN